MLISWIKKLVVNNKYCVKYQDNNSKMWDGHEIWIDSEYRESLYNPSVLVPGFEVSLPWKGKILQPTGRQLQWIKQPVRKLNTSYIATQLAGSIYYCIYALLYFIVLKSFIYCSYCQLATQLKVCRIIIMYSIAYIIYVYFTEVEADLIKKPKKRKGNGTYVSC